MRHRNMQEIKNSMEKYKINHNFLDSIKKINGNTSLRGYVHKHVCQLIKILLRLN